MSARTPSIFRPSHLIGACGLAALVVAAGVEIRAGAQATKPQPGTSTPGTSSQGTAAPGAAGQGANAQTPGRGDAGRSGGPPNGPGSSSRTWWKDEAIKKEIGLRADQLKRIEDLFAQRAKDIEPLRREIDKQLALLDLLIADRTTDLRTMIHAIELQDALVEVPRSRMNESLIVMYYRMRRVLEAEQDKKLQVILDRIHNGRGSSH